MTEEFQERRLTEAQEKTLGELCSRYQVEYDPDHYWPQFDLPEGYVAGWIGGPDRPKPTLYVGVSAEGEASS